MSFPGDVVGPGFFEPYLDAENTLNKPYGGADRICTILLTIYISYFT